MTTIKTILAIILLTASIATTTNTTQVSWFREKYLKQTYYDYYIYTYERHSLGDNDIDMCPDTYKSASFYAITGLSDFGKNRMSKLPPRISLAAMAAAEATNSTQIHFQLPKPHGIYILDMTLRDILIYISNMTDELFKMAFMAINIAMLILVYLIFVMLILRE